VCRRAERATVALVSEGRLAADVAVYVNRLSDYLFVAARYAAMRAGADEAVYKKSRGVTVRHLDGSVGGIGGGATTAAAVVAAASRSAAGVESDDAGGRGGSGSAAP
jgi:hypothetical protein